MAPTAGSQPARTDWTRPMTIASEKPASWLIDHRGTELADAGATWKNDIAARRSERSAKDLHLGVMLNPQAYQLSQPSASLSPVSERAFSRFPSIVALAGCLGCLVASAVGAGAQSPADNRRVLVQQADRRIRELQEEADRLAAQSKTLLTELRGLQLQRSVKAEELKKAEASL